MTSLKLRAAAASCAPVIDQLGDLGASLPEGRTRDVVDQATLALQRATWLLVNEAAALVRHEYAETADDL